MNAVIITGQLRTIENVFKSIVKNVIIPNEAIVFFCCETNEPNKLQQLLEKYPSVKLGGKYIVDTFRNVEFNSILYMIKNSKRKGLTPEIFERGRLADGLNWQYDFVETSGSILQHYQFWKIWSIVLEYERINNCKFTNIMKTRTDIFFNDIVNIDTIFNENCSIKKLYDTNQLVDDSVYYDKLVNPNELTTKYIITFVVDLVYIGKRDVFDLLSQVVFHYSLWDSGKSFSFNAETQFHEFCKNYNIYHIGIQLKNSPHYFYSDIECNNFLFGIRR